MVRYETILKTIQEYLRCRPTVGEMRAELSTATHREHLEALKTQNLLNPLELENYEFTLTELERSEALLRSRPWDKGLQRMMEAEENQLFLYERRLIEGVKTYPVPDVDRAKYKKDVQYTEFDDLKDKSNLGKLEAKQITVQEKHINNDTITEADKKAVGDYYSGDMSHISHEIKHGKYLKKLSYEDLDRVKHIDKTIDKSTGLEQDTTLYMGAELINIHLKPGDHSRLKGYTSTSFQEKIADNFIKRHHKDNRFKFIIRAPKGTKGLCANAETFKDVSFHDEHEYLLPRNIGYTVLDIDYENNVIEIQLD